MTLAVGVCLPQFTDDPSVPIAAAREAEDLGYASVSLFDHLQPLGGPPERPVLEAFTMLTAIACATSRVRLLPLVARATLRPPATTAHIASALWRVSQGRFVLGLGAGDRASAREDASVGLPADVGQSERQAHLVATIDAVRTMAPQVPVWVGGTSAVMQRLAGGLADAWNVWAATPDEVQAGRATMADAARDAERVTPKVTWGGQVLVAARADDAAARFAAWGSAQRPHERARTICGDPDLVAAQLVALADAGVSEVLLSFVGGGAREQRRIMAESVLPLL